MHTSCKSTEVVGVERTGGFGLNIDVRKIGLWMLGLGGVAMTAGLVADAVRTNDDPSIASSEGIFDLSSFGHALFFGGICIAFVGLLGFMFGGRIYRQGPVPRGNPSQRRPSARPGRRADCRVAAHHRVHGRRDELGSR